MNKSAAKTLALTVLAILAFAGNSLLTRRALTGADIGANQFLAIRLISGALMLTLLGYRRQAILPRTADLPGIVSLFVYAAAFTFAYNSLGAVTGALILFPTVQLALVLIATLRGVPPSRPQRLGLAIAVVGLLVLLGPHGSAPPLMGAFLMVVAGMGWGTYTFLGRTAIDPLARTARNFIGAAALGAVMMLASHPSQATRTGIMLAIASGAVTSALGYVVWYAALPRLSVATAGAAQLLVPVITSAAGIWWLGEAPSLELFVAILLIVCGIGLTYASPKPSKAQA
ncbi:MAG: DMT family transporter [Steroidobacteraceae bacterium]